MKGTLKTRLMGLFCTLFIVVIVVWGLFYGVVYHFIYQNAEKQLSAATNQITQDLNREFSAMEKLGYGLSQQSAVKRFLDTTDIEQRLNAAAEVDKFLHGSYNVGFVSDIIAIFPDGSFYRFGGDLSNASCSLLARRVQADPKQGYIVQSTNDRQRLGCVTTVYDGGSQQMGHLILMTDEEKLRELMYSYVFDSFLTVGIAAENALVTASNDLLPELYEAQLQGAQGNTDLIQKQMGLTPFYAVAALDTSYLSTATVFFTIAAIVTLLTFALVLAAFIRAMQKLFVTPMLGLMENAKQIGVGQTDGESLLAYTGQEDFDRLTDQINRMILRLEENSKRLLGMQSRVQQAELDRQHTLIIALKKQINAHFTVNTLNVIRRFNEVGENEKASEMCEGLSMLLRYANGAEDFIGGLEEIQVLEKYVDIMQIRYPGRFTVSYDIDDQLDDVRLPRMLVQPIIENAVIHGLLGMKNGTLALSARVEEEQIIFSVSDNGRGIPQSELEKLQEKIHTAPDHPWNEEGIEHIALPNIQKRVVSLFGVGYGLAVFSTPGLGTQVILTLPTQQ